MTLTASNFLCLEIGLIDILLLGCCTRFSCTLIQSYLSQWYHNQPPLPHPFPSHWMNELTNKWDTYLQPKLTKNFPLLIYPRILYPLIQSEVGNNATGGKLLLPGIKGDRRYKCKIREEGEDNERFFLSAVPVLLAAA